MRKEKNCGILTNGQFLSVSVFSYSDLRYSSGGKQDSSDLHCGLPCLNQDRHGKRLLQSVRLSLLQPSAETVAESYSHHKCYDHMVDTSNPPFPTVQVHILEMANRLLQYKVLLCRDILDSTFRYYQHQEAKIVYKN